MFSRKWALLLTVCFVAGGAHALYMAEMPPEGQTKNTQPAPRLISLKLPLEQEDFHWTFMKKDELLAGKLVLSIGRGGKKQDIVIFEKGKFGDGWDTVPFGATQFAGSTVKPGEIYFMFLSQKKYDTAPGDEIELTLTVKKDLDGIGPMFTAVLPKGEYKAKGGYSALFDEWQPGEGMKNLPKDTVDKLRAMMDNKALLENWKNQWSLRITSDNGWMPPEQRDGLKKMLDQVNAPPPPVAPFVKAP